MWVIGWKGRKEKGYWRKEGRRRVMGVGRKEKGDWKEEGRRRVMGVGRKEKGDWKEEGTNEKGDWRKEGRNERMKQKKKGNPTLFCRVFCFYGAQLSNALKYNSWPDLSGRKNILLLTTYLCFFASVNFPLFFFRSEPIDK